MARCYIGTVGKALCDAPAVARLTSGWQKGPGDFHLFGHLKMHLAGKRFATDAELNSAVPSRLQTLDTDFYEALVPRWDKCLNVRDDYVAV